MVRVVGRAALLGDLGGPLRKQIQRAPESLSGVASSTGNNRLDSLISRHEADDPGSLQVVESVKNDRFGDERAHAGNL